MNISVVAPAKYARKTLPGNKENPLWDFIVQASVMGIKAARDGDNIVMRGISDTAEFSLPLMLWMLENIEGLEVHGYQCWGELSAEMLAQDVLAVIPEIAPAGEGETRSWQQMPMYREIEGRHFAAMTYPVDTSPTPNGSHALLGSDLLKAKAAGVTLLVASELPSPPAEV